MSLAAGSTVPAAQGDRLGCLWLPAAFWEVQELLTAMPPVKCCCRNIQIKVGWLLHGVFSVIGMKWEFSVWIATKNQYANGAVSFKHLVRVLGAGKPCDCVLWFGHKTPCRFLENQTCLISFTSGVFASGRDLTHSSPEPLLRKHVVFDYRSLFTVFQGNITLGNEKKKNPKHKQTTLRQDCRETDCCHCLMMFIGCFVPQCIVSSLRFEGSFSIGSGA